MEKTLTDQNFEQEVLKADLPVLVDFYANWCQPCKLLAPIVTAVANSYEGKIKIGKLDVEINQTTAEKYGVMSVPTLILFKDGKETKRIVGLRSRESLVKELGLE